jgi:RNA polymerase sigma factor (sigma-70 family)
VAAASDPPLVRSHEGEYLRRFLVARAAGDRDGMHAWWEMLLVDNVDRVRGMVGAEARGRLSADEQQEAVQRALIKLARNMALTFKGSSMGEWVKATRTLVHGVCIDVQRDAERISRRERSLDAGWNSGDEDGPGRHDAAIAKDAIEHQRLDDERAAEEDEFQLGRDFLDWALPQLSPRLRAVMELDRQNVPVEEMQQQLGVSRDVIYAARSRALKELAKLMEEYPS